MGIVLRRADIVSLEEKREIEERLSMYDDLMEKDPKMRKIRAESEAKGFRIAIVTLVKGRFPSLTELAQQRVKQVTMPDDLRALLEMVINASDEATARRLLMPSVA